MSKAKRIRATAVNKMKTKNKSYDKNDFILGVFSKEELRQLLNTTRKSFECIISRLNRGLTKSVNYKGQRYNVYIYESEV